MCAEDEGSNRRELLQEGIVRGLSMAAVMVTQEAKSDTEGDRIALTLLRVAGFESLEGLRRARGVLVGEHDADYLLCHFGYMRDRPFDTESCE